MPGMKWELVQRKLVYDGFFKLSQLRVRYQLYGGGWGNIEARELFERSDAVAVLPYDPTRDKVVLIEQFRVGAMAAPEGPWLTEIVAGLIDDGEGAEETARREAREEAGCELQELLHICDYYASPGGFSERIAVYLGKTDSRDLDGIKGLAAEGEDIRVFVVDSEEAFRMLASGKIMSAMPIVALQWLQLNRERVRAVWP
ncbi:MAG: NUDIX domain-containing protein [Gammaproteobacteria bacterium]